MVNMQPPALCRRCGHGILSFCSLIGFSDETSEWTSLKIGNNYPPGGRYMKLEGLRCNWCFAAPYEAGYYVYGANGIPLVRVESISNYEDVAHCHACKRGVLAIHYEWLDSLIGVLLKESRPACVGYNRVYEAYSDVRVYCEKCGANADEAGYVVTNDLHQTQIILDEKDEEEFEYDILVGDVVQSVAELKQVLHDRFVEIKRMFFKKERA